MNNSGRSIDYNHGVTANNKARSLLNSIKELWNLVNKEQLSMREVINAELRLSDITDSYKTCQALYEREYTEEAEQNWVVIRGAYQQVATRVREGRAELNPNLADVSFNNQSIRNSTMLESRPQNMKLEPIAVPTFAGKQEDWLSFKCSFLSMVHLRKDLDNITKLNYLRKALQGAAFNKIAIYHITEENYESA